MGLYLNASRPDKSLAKLKFLSEHAPDDLQTRDWYSEPVALMLLTRHY